ncbi:malate dehydrogenase (quinone) [Chitinophaga terrae (ex Kim and Jung 2007)]|uniref:Probable malate:quinone oxidoreductase n=1 Tax=Chitinophaga terrae (ex Kim and Jung 2007) TaxID=408074 RepID=A0A1H4DRP5_9BACT|nr:malate:quinone oxidoreductase [Chitinophaga terrae (ex Kim and Jung 2007)]MDQ0110107.1 malate dehydrogenase (quinone) [Chitinophaga terrae (ex Kim and Jung 2007)]GEP91098.1 putative malate:quinone oxidoreductase [Chitinophaga terrae (ex Kim and Jung 2007)]SEA75297.1 malate dehydrogenase (quinone) [Chitinophaga terrae (ex Kim and Jung 2007)]
MFISKSTAGTGPDVVLIGAGIMSATLGMLLKELEPGLTIAIYERLDVAAAESSDAWNNAGTGHSAFCELNYTPQKPDGSVDIKKAVNIAEQFEVSRQFWAYLVENNIISNPHSFIQSIPHMSFVWGEENVDYLKKRFTALKQCYLFKEMQYSEDKEQLKNWMPLVMNGRDPNQKVAATRMEIGTDVNFGALSRALFNHLQKMDGVTMHFNYDVRDLKKQDDGTWRIKVKNRETRDKEWVTTQFVFIGAGGGSLPLLEKSDIPEGKGFGGFPVSGQWLRCTNPEVIEQHRAKVYGKASVGAPPMSVPHLDTRMIDGQKALLFGPYAGFSTKFLKNGSYLDLPLSIKANNIRPMVSAGLDNIPLTKYLIAQVRQKPEDRLDALREYFPEAKMEDWQLEIAGQRVQVIKKDPEHGGILEFGTEVVSAADGSLAALLGASPGASTAVSIMLNLLKRCFKEQVETAAWQEKLKKMIPSYGQSLLNNTALTDQLRAWTTQVLELGEMQPA